MKMKARVRLFVTIYLLGFVFGVIISEIVWPGSMAYFTVAWFLIFATTQYYLLKCPNCGEFACKHNFKGFEHYAPYAKDQCSKCGKPF